MKLTRLVLVVFNRTPSGLEYFASQVKGVSVRLLESRENTALIAATIAIQNSPIDENNYLVAPKELRSECEHAVEHIAKVIAFANKTSVSFYSPLGICASFLYESQSELEQLKTSLGFPKIEGAKLFQPDPPKLNKQLFSDLADRLDGLNLLSEAINHTYPENGFRDYIRLFENAFRRPATSIRKKLQQFLNPKMGYTGKEIESWLNLRHPMSHADNIKSNSIALSRDVLNKIHRIEQAAYDTLLNKKVWGTFSKERRSNWIPSCCSSGPNNLTATSGVPFSYTFSQMDRFERYPINLDYTVNCISEHWPESTTG